MAKWTCALALMLSAACGPTIGDACTTAADCLNQTCVTERYAPGGLCSQACSMTGQSPTPACPMGSVCVRDALNGNTPGCLKVCRTANDCRSGYLCQDARNSGLVCVGPGF